MTDTAIVETLTAEVRVLMVGNRQITLSVARQLDQAPLERLEWFGRVRLDNDRRNFVIGRDQSSGALAVAPYLPTVGRPVVNVNDLGGRVRVCRASARIGPYWQLAFRNRKIELHVDLADPCLQHGPSHPSSDNACATWDPNGLDSEIAEVVTEHDEFTAVHQQAAALPLVVLAGLR